MSLPGVEYGLFLLHMILLSQPGPGWEPISCHLLHTLPSSPGSFSHRSSGKGQVLSRGHCECFFLYAVPRAFVLVLEGLKVGYYMTGETSLVTIPVTALMGWQVRSIFPLPP